MSYCHSVVASWVPLVWVVGGTWVAMRPNASKVNFQAVAVWVVNRTCSCRCCGRTVGGQRTRRVVREGRVDVVVGGAADRGPVDVVLVRVGDPGQVIEHEVGADALGVIAVARPAEGVVRRPADQRRRGGGRGLMAGRPAGTDRTRAESRAVQRDVVEVALEVAVVGSTSPSARVERRGRCGRRGRRRATDLAAVETGAPSASEP